MTALPKTLTQLVPLPWGKKRDGQPISGQTHGAGNGDSNRPRKPKGLYAQLSQEQRTKLANFDGELSSGPKDFDVSGSF